MSDRGGTADAYSVFLTVYQAADALLAAYEAKILAGVSIGHSQDRVRQITEIVELIDPDDIFEHDAFRQSFINELAHLETGGEVLS